MGAASILALLVAAGCAAGSAQYREQRAMAEQLCEERGGVEIFAPIPERMDVLTVFRNAGEYQVVQVQDDPNRGPTSYQVITQVPRSEMAKHTLAWGVSAYITAAHYLSTDRVASVDLLIEDFQYHDHITPMGSRDAYLLPDRESPNGMYRYSLEDAGHPDCAAFDDMVAAFAEQGFQYGYTPQQEFNVAVVNNSQCVAISYLGNKENYNPSSFIYHEYSDDLPDLGVGQNFDGLISPSNGVIARLRNFSAGSRIGHCGTTNIFEHFVYGK